MKYMIRDARLVVCECSMSNFESDTQHVLFFSTEVMLIQDGLQ